MYKSDLGVITPILTLHQRIMITAFENALVDKLGQNDIVWEKDGFSNPSKTWITYEEVIDATTSQRLIQAEEKSRDRMGGSSAR